MLGSQGSEPRNESEGRIAGGKSPLSTLLLFLAVHAKIKQQLKKSLHPQSCGNDCWSSQHSGSTSPCSKRTKEMCYWTSFIPFETSLSFPLRNKSLFSRKSRVMDLRGRMTKWQLGWSRGGSDLTMRWSQKGSCSQHCWLGWCRNPNSSAIRLRSWFALFDDKESVMDLALCPQGRSKSVPPPDMLCIFWVFLKCQVTSGPTLSSYRKCWVCNEQ